MSLYINYDIDVEDMTHKYLNLKVSLGHILCKH